MRIKDLATQDGASRLQLALGLDQGQVSNITKLVNSVLASSPHVSNTYIGKSAPNISFYDYKNNKLGVGHKSVDVLAHELGHAQSLANAGDFYKTLLGASKRATRASNLLALPIASFIALNPKLSKDEKVKMLNLATGVSTGLALPNIYEEVKASTSAIKHSPTSKLDTGLAMLPGIVSHVANDFTAPSTYYLVKALSGDNND